MYPDSWIYRSFKSCNFDLWWKQNGGHGSNLRKIQGFKLIIHAWTVLIWKFQNAVCTATSHFILISVIIFVVYELAAKHGKAPLSLTTRWWMEPDFGSCQLPDISRSHLYRSTIAWTPPTAIYREYTVSRILTWFTLCIYPRSLRLLLWYNNKCIIASVLAV